MGSHSVSCHPADVTFPPLPLPIKAGTRFSDPGEMQGLVDLAGLVTYRGGIPSWRWSPIPVLTGLDVEQLRSCDERRYHNANTTVSAPYVQSLSHFRETYGRLFVIKFRRNDWVSSATQRQRGSIFSERQPLKAAFHDTDVLAGILARM